MTERSTTSPTAVTSTTIGIDIGDRMSHICVLDGAGNVIETGVVASTPAAFTKRFERDDPTRIAIEVGGQSAWIDELLGGLGTRRGPCQCSSPEDDLRERIEERRG